MVYSDLRQPIMQILDSAEVRWFVPSNHPIEKLLTSWFESATAEPARVDHYLRTGRDSLGFKARLVEGEPAKIETKFLLGSLGPVKIEGDVVGTIEIWRKLSLIGEDRELARDGVWIAIDKLRRLRKFAYSGGELNEVPVASRPDVGCGFELTELRMKLGGSPRLVQTLGLEAFGPGDILLDVLLQACRTAFRARADISLVAEWSKSYPRWLESLFSSEPTPIHA